MTCSLQERACHCCQLSNTSTLPLLPRCFLKPFDAGPAVLCMHHEEYTFLSRLQLAVFADLACRAWMALGDYSGLDKLCLLCRWRWPPQ